MKVRSIIFWVGVIILTMTLCIAYEPVGAAPSSGEVKTVSANFGNMVPIPFFEVGAANDWMFLLYDFLVGRNPDGQLETETGVTKRWEMSPDALTWTFYLRSGIKFHDGVELTAKDVKFTIEQLMGPGAVSDGAPFLRRDVKTIEIKDPYTVVINLKQPNIFLPNFLRDGSLTGQIVPKDYYEKVGRDQFAKRPIGSGPYKFQSLDAGSSIKLEATDKHWRDGVPKYKYMTYQVIPEESTRMAMLKTGEADITRISRDAAKDALKADLNVYNRGNVQVLIFQPCMQWASPVFSDVRFRKALNLAVDKEAMIKHLFAGMAKPAGTFCGSNIGVFGRDLVPLKPSPYDPQEAKRLVKEGGWEGHEFPLISFDRPGCPEFRLVVEALAGYWEQIGLRPRVRNTEWPLFRVALREGKTQNTVYGADTFVEPNLAPLYLRLLERWYGKGPYAIVNVPELNERFERIEKSIDIAEVTRLLAEINRYAYDQYFHIPICEFSDMVATTKRLPKWDLGRRENDRNYNELIRQR